MIQLYRGITPLCDLEMIEHWDFGKIQNECIDHCGHEYSANNKYRQRCHGNAAGCKYGCDQQVNN